MSAILLSLLVAAGSVPANPVVLETDSFRLVLSADGKTRAFVDRATGENYCDAEKGLPFAVWVEDTIYPASTVRLEQGLLVIQFGEVEREARFQVAARRRRIEFELVGISGKAEGLRELRFASIPLTLAGLPSEPFAVSPLALNLETHCAEIPGFTATLSGATCYAELGMQGAAVAVVACPSDELRDALKDAVSAAPDLPKSPIGGPWALDSELNRQSYFLDVTGKVNEQTVTNWIAMLEGLGVRQLDLHGGYAFRWGDYRPNPAEYPRGLDSLKAVVDQLHAAGISVGLHTYAMFIAKDTPWVTPVPDPGLAKDATFTLDAALSATDTIVPVVETTEQMSALTGFHHRNSATIQIDDELIVYAGVSKEPPYGFKRCTRGACGTVPAAHAKNARVFHLKECFGLFAPDPDADLFERVIDKTAETYNYCGFDMMYMDALDGSDVVDLKGGGKFGGHYAARFTHQLFRRLKKPPLMEMSTFGHHLWVVRSRMGAWDACQRAPQTFADIHMLSNRVWQRHFLPTNLGWWGVFNYSGVQPKRSLTEDVEYICAKALGTDSSLSFLLGFSPDTFFDSYNQQRLGAIVRQYEQLRSSGRVSRSLRSKLAAPGQAFRLEGDTEGQYEFRPVRFHRHDVASSDGRENWQVENRFDAQVPGIRIETLLSAEPFDGPNSAVLEDFSRPEAFDTLECQAEVSATFSVVDQPTRNSPVSARLMALNRSAAPERAWVSVERGFENPLNLSGRGMGLWIYGDGSGALLNVQLRSPKHVTFALTEHYVRINFRGWRYVELIETEDYSIEQYEWPYAAPRADWQAKLASAMQLAYPLYHAHLNYAQIGILRLALNDLPQGREVEVFLGPIRSVPHKSATISSPELRFNGRAIRFPVTLQSGHMLEYAPHQGFIVCNAKGDLLKEGPVVAEPPRLESGVNSIEFKCGPADAATTVHARVTLTTAGNGLGE
jgi:hypothetical protein